MTVSKENGSWSPSFPKSNYPSLRDVLIKTPHVWLEGRRLDDGAEGLWRVFDGLYDLTDFIDKHPGGSTWLNLTKGTDITEAFEAHHITTLPESILKNYFVRKASVKRNSPFTFKDDGFYRTLKSRVREQLKTMDKSCVNTSKRITDSLAVGMFMLSIAACWMPTVTGKVIMGVLGGLFLGWTAIAAHNYLHSKDNWRMYLFNYLFYSSREFRIAHALSHHLYTNTLQDFEITVFEPFIQWLPKDSKSKFSRYAPFGYALFLYSITFDLLVAMKLITSVSKMKLRPYFHVEDLVPFTLPLAMFIFSKASLSEIFAIWMLVYHMGSFFFLLIGLNSAHHDPDIFHDGDEPLQDTDWGLHQLNAVMDRIEINGSLFKVLTNFGEHGMHHLFPALDHSLIPGLNEVFVRTCEEFSTKLRMTTQFRMFIGQFKQIARVQCKKTSKDKQNSD